MASTTCNGIRSESQDELTAYDSAIVSQDRKWFENSSEEKQQGNTKTLQEAHSRFSAVIERLDLSPDYSQDHKSIRSLQDFIRFAETLKDSHIEKRSKRGQEQLLRKIAAFDTFSRNYSSVADAISSIEPYGGAGALWSCLSVTLTVVARKIEYEDLIHTSFKCLSFDIPRLEAYTELYPTERMVSLICELHRQVLEFFEMVVLYYKDKGLRGFAHRIWCTTFTDDIATSLDAIKETSENIKAEGSIAICSEVREVRLKFESEFAGLRATSEKQHQHLVAIDQKVQEQSQELTEVSTKIAAIELQKHRKMLERLKGVLVTPDYNADDLLSTACTHITRLSVASAKRQSYQRALRKSPFTNWLQRTVNEDWPKAPSIIWMSSETVDDNTISYMASDVIDEVLGDSSPAMPVFHSMYPLKVPTTQAQPVSVNLLKELAYQLMCRGKSTNAIIRKLVEVSTSSEDVSAQDLTTILADLVRGDFFQENDLTSLDQQQPNRAQPLFWVIDRIDRSFEQPKKPKRLYAFLHLLEGLVVASQGRLRILITSLYTPRRLDGRWEDNQADDDEGLKHFLEYVHKKA